MNRYLPVLVLVTVMLFALPGRAETKKYCCLLYTSDAADE